MAELIKLRTERTVELTHLELDENLLYVSNEWSADRTYKEGMIVYYTDNTTSTSGIAYTWYRANVNHGPDAVFDLTKWDPIGASSVSGIVNVRDFGGVNQNVGVVEFNSDFTVTFNGNTATIAIDGNVTTPWADSGSGNDAIYYEAGPVFIGHDLVIDASYQLSVAGNSYTSGNIIVGGTVDGVDIATFYSDYQAHQHTLVPATLTNYATLYPNASSVLADADIDGGALADGDVIVWNGTTKKWNRSSLSVAAHNLGSHSDVDPNVSGSPADNEVLIYNTGSGLWENTEIVTDNSTGFSTAPFVHNHDDRYWTKTALLSNQGAIIDYDNLFNTPTIPDLDAEYVVMSADAVLTNERVLTAGTGITITDGGPGGAVTIELTSTSSSIAVKDNNTTIGTRAGINFLDNSFGNLEMLIVDDSGNNEVEITLTPKIIVEANGSAVGSPQPKINFVDSANITFTVTEDSGSDKIEIEADVSGFVTSVNGSSGDVILDVGDINDIIIVPANFPGPGTGSPYTSDTNILAYDDDIGQWTNIPAIDLIAALSQFDLDSLTDVIISPTGLAEGDIIYYDTGLGSWANGTPSDADLYTATELGASNSGTVAVHWDNITNAPNFSTFDHSHYVYQLVDVDDYPSGGPSDGDILVWNAISELWEVSSFAASGASQSVNDKGWSASAVSVDGGQASASTITDSPISGSYINVLVNGVDYEVGDGVKTKVFYFSNDGGTTARDFDDVAAGDTLHFNPSVAGFNLSAGWRISLNYLTI